MTLLDWFPAVTSSTIFAVVSFAVATYYKAKVEKLVQHNLDRDLEGLRAELRRTDEAMRANLRTRDDQISALRSGALTGMATRQSDLSKRRLQASENLWAAVVSLNKYKFVTSLLGAIQIEHAIDLAASGGPEGTKVREFGDEIWRIAGLDSAKPNEKPELERPFLSPVVWALFSAYQQILLYPNVQLAAIRTGTGAEIIKDPKEMLDLVKKALPNQAENIEKFGVTFIYRLVDELEEKLLQEIIQSLEGAEADSKSIENAAAILKASNDLAKAMADDVPKLDSIMSPSTA